MADPEWPNKVRSGRLDEIVPCIGCNECLNNGVAARIFSCSVNPLCHHEVDYAALPPAPGNKTVLVVGGGPGGMKAALTAAECGCSVQLWEKTDRLGGMLQHAGAPDFKKDVRDYVEYLIGAMLHSSVQVMLNKEATVEEILDGCFDRVIIATGSSPVVPPIPGVEHARIATDMLVDEKKPEGHVVIIGGGLVGCEVAVYCAQTAQKVTVIESLRDILLTADHCRNNDQMLRKLVADSGAEIVTSARVTGITDKGLTYQKDGQEYTLECDTVAIAVGYSANNKLIDQLEEKGKDFWAIGDAVSPGKIIDAVHSGYRAVRLMQ